MVYETKSKIIQRTEPLVTFGCQLLYCINRLYSRFSPPCYMPLWFRGMRFLFSGWKVLVRSSSYSIVIRPKMNYGLWQWKTNTHNSAHHASYAVRIGTQCGKTVQGPVCVPCVEHTTSFLLICSVPSRTKNSPFDWKWRFCCKALNHDFRNGPVYMIPTVQGKSQLCTLIVAFDEEM